ncbi:uncharacterized protein LOC128726416 [Anopheles nili]|uniref:uncharacterized protein LOC128726416 n=1 Tax=Anopheles nili TaxID=185578 RepID=UPI00237C37C0|nr:uncharacterized protein LOC128726416 [Anopheles nili]
MSIGEWTKTSEQRSEKIYKMLPKCCCENQIIPTAVRLWIGSTSVVMLKDVFIWALVVSVVATASVDPRCSRYSQGMEAQVLPHLNDCRKFVICDMGGNGQVLPCPTGLYFSATEHACSYDQSVCTHGELTGTNNIVPMVPNLPEPPQPVVPVQPKPEPEPKPLPELQPLPIPTQIPVVVPPAVESIEIHPKPPVSNWLPIVTAAPTTVAPVQEQTESEQLHLQSVCWDQPAGKVYPVAHDCGLYVVCMGNHNAIVQRCPKSLLYDHKQQRCEFAEMSFCATPRAEDRLVLDIHGVNMALLEAERQELLAEQQYANPAIPVEEKASPPELNEQHQNIPQVVIVREPEYVAAPEPVVDLRIIDKHPRCLSRNNLALTVELAHDTDCSKYLVCVGQIAFEKRCPAGQHWNAKRSWCDFPSAAGCTL